ncbi:carboxypeptidase-like regulatory domain-containing protein [Hymenobacter tibetensis]|uniref:Carboxypeptidase-like regulatory domain-containing protein n=1 Tax=Hymenobacter tibetensis TaxID=497967 RepID=A0ABY4D2Q1_9BACT|nr:carboxypeptidase regulatory-like domain-containing protein [Hymenobacter tibetensis]UOG76795.1 carboxypeptidase-like regulatory domain-containing protein [Hymenobacter tibetensis]
MKTSSLNRSLIAFILFMTGLQLSAHIMGNGALTGNLRDGDTNEPIPHTNVVLLRATDHRLAATGTTDAQGNFHFRNVPVGKYLVQSTALGYQAQQPSVALMPLRKHQMGALTLRGMASQPVVKGSRNAVAQQVKQPTAVKPAV